MAIHDYLPFLPAPRARFVTESGAPVHGIAAELTDVSDVYHAAEKIRDAGYAKWDVHSPFPIHGMEEAMGQRRTMLPFIVGGAAATGVFGALALQWFTNYFDYEFVVQGKPITLAGGWQPFVMVMFELGVLLSAFAALFGMLALNGLPRWHHPLFRRDSFLRCTDDLFVICVEATDPKFDPDQTRRLLESVGGQNITLIED